MGNGHDCRAYSRGAPPSYPLHYPLPFFHSILHGAAKYIAWNEARYFTLCGEDGVFRFRLMHLQTSTANGVSSFLCKLSFCEIDHMKGYQQNICMGGWVYIDHIEDV
ncbi:uncharacterized protein LOC131031792 [Cryptomeria japonica]|uniref:uncharacterized protein LOC131031792 n=1 Tax=Cryptomeria japonica TaxID=3369 RepID=UPI0025AB606B|nr:uncharacterized protein LOC131031792 [Cryptomeria japonica]